MKKMGSNVSKLFKESALSSVLQGHPKHQRHYNSEHEALEMNFPTINVQQTPDMSEQHKLNPVNSS